MEAGEGEREREGEREGERRRWKWVLMPPHCNRKVCIVILVVHVWYHDNWYSLARSLGRWFQ